MEMQAGCMECKLDAAVGHKGTPAFSCCLLRFVTTAKNVNQDLKKYFFGLGVLFVCHFLQILILFSPYRAFLK